MTTRDDGRDGKDKDKAEDIERDRKDFGLGANPPGASVSREQMERFDFHQEQFGLFTSENARYDLVDKPDGTIWHIKPMKYTLGLGIPGVLLLLSSMLLQLLIARFGNPFISADGQDYAGLVRLLAMLAGGIMLIIAWPIKKPPGWNVEQQEQYADSKQRAADKRMRNRR